MLNDSLARSSELFMYIAALIYTVVFIAFTSDVVANSRVTRRLEGRSEGTAQKPAVKAKIKVGAGAVSGASATANVAADTVRTGGTEQGTGERGMGYKGAAARALEGEVADSAMLYTGVRRPAARIAVVVMVLAALVHTAAVIMRGIAAQRVPWGNMYEFCTTGALMVSAVFLITLIFRDVRFVGTLVSGLVLIMLCAATIGFPTPVGHLKPALQSYWLVIHVSIAVLASGVFTITFAMAVLQLVQTRREQRILNGKSGGWAFMRLVPSAQALENFAFRMNALAFVMWTFTLAAGAIWANHAWGRYWGWDTKEVWTFVIWVVYAAYLHARATRGWAIHVSIAVLASGVFTITFAMAVLQLVQTRREQRILNGKSGGWAFMRLVPSAQALENFAFRMNALAFVMWTFTLAAGAIWANHAWGRYWGWDTKEVWTFVIWVVYAAYLHARATRGWAGPRSAWLSIIGYACIIFNFTVVNIFFSGLHSYSGL